MPGLYPAYSTTLPILMEPCAKVGCDMLTHHFEQSHWLQPFVKTVHLHDLESDTGVSEYVQTFSTLELAISVMSPL